MSSPSAPGSPNENPSSPGDQPTPSYPSALGSYGAQTTPLSQAGEPPATPAPGGPPYSAPYPPYPPAPGAYPPYGQPATYGQTGQYPPAPYPAPYPPYPAPYPTQYPPYAAPSAAQGSKKRSRWPLWTGLGIGIFLVVLLACCGGGYVFYQTSVAPAIGASTAALTFCIDEQSQDYTGAYGQLSKNLQSQISESTFTTDNQQFDSSKGQVTNCQVNSKSGNATNNGYTLILNVTRDITYSGRITLIKEGNNWRIDSIDSALPVT